MSEKSKVLVVDDDMLSAKAMTSRLEKNGFETIHLKNGQECVDHILGEGIEDIDVVLLDIMMPEMNGDEALEKVREVYSAFQLPVIMLTSKTEDEEVVRLLKLGANDYLTKPVNIDVAIARINTQLQIVELVKNSFKSKQLQTITSMVTTLNHEINNPLAIALGQLSLGYERLNDERIGKAVKALHRITEIIKKIEEITTGNRDIAEVNYAGNTNMFDLHNNPDSKE
jgi:DNA-binding response OmpR family regulator